MKTLLSMLSALFKPTPKQPEPEPKPPTPKPEPLPDGHLTKHFKLEEFTRSATAQANGINNEPSNEHRTNLKKLANTLEEVRFILGNNPILISSGYRSKSLNALVGGSPTSDHANGLAVDFTCPKFGSVQKICETLAESGLAFDQIIFEQGDTHWIHLGIGPRLRRQVLSWSPATGYLPGIKKLS